MCVVGGAFGAANLVPCAGLMATIRTVRRVAGSGSFAMPSDFWRPKLLQFWATGQKSDGYVRCGFRRTFRFFLGRYSLWVMQTKGTAWRQFARFSTTAPLLLARGATGVTPPRTWLNLMARGQGGFLFPFRTRRDKRAWDRLVAAALPMLGRRERRAFVVDLALRRRDSRANLLRFLGGVGLVRFV